VSMTIDKNTIGIWYVELPFGNWMATMYRDGDEFKLRGRFRFVVDDDLTTESNDHKEWFESVMSTTDEALAIKQVRKAAAALGDYDEILHEGLGPDHMIAELQRKRYAHATTHMRN
jgi:hypothetical protein